jgi:hypothetical protein
MAEVKKEIAPCAPAVKPWPFTAGGLETAQTPAIISGKF